MRINAKLLAVITMLSTTGPGVAFDPVSTNLSLTADLDAPHVLTEEEVLLQVMQAFPLTRRMHRWASGIEERIGLDQMRRPFGENSRLRVRRDGPGAYAVTLEIRF